MRRTVVKAGGVVLALLVFLAPAAHLLERGNRDASARDAQHTVIPMLALLDASPANQAMTAVEAIIELEDAWAVEDTRTESETPLLAGMRNGSHELGYDEESRTFYCTIGMEAEDVWPQLALFAQQAQGKDGLRVAWIDDYSYDYPADSVRDNWRYELLAYTDTEYEYIGLVFTGLPIVNLNIHGGTQALSETYTPARIAVAGEGYEGINSGAMVHLRGGGYGKEIPKDSYRVELHTLDAHGDSKADVSVLGMPADSDWLLIANAGDATCARNELGFGLWRDWNADGNAFMLLQSQMVEVFVENEYAGLYQLMQRVQFEEEIVRMGGNPQTDYAARVINALNIEDRPVLDLTQRTNFIAELRHAPSGVSAKTAFAQFEPYFKMNVQMAGEHEALAQEEFISLALQCTDVREMMEYFLFTQAAGLGYDNVFNNVYMWALKQGDHYIYHLSPWDMDMGFNKMLGSDEDTINLYFKQAWRMIDLDVGGAQQILRDVWNEKRAGVVSDDAMYQRIEAFQEMINRSGAYLRESEKYRGGAQELDLTEILVFAVEHLSTIDREIERMWPMETAMEF